MDKKKKKTKGDVYEDPLKPTAFEIEVANYLHNNLPSVDGKLSGCRVSIFYAADAVELLTKSQWSKSKLKTKSNENAQFSSEESAVRFMTKMLEKRMISRAIKAKKKVVNKRKEQEKKKVKTTKTTDSKTSKSEKPQNEAGEQQNCETTDKNAESKSSSSSSPTNPPPAAAAAAAETSKSKKSSAGDSSFGFPSFLLSFPAPKPIRLEYTEAQVFTLADPDSVYVWIHEPPPSLKTWLLGAALIAGIILCCFFPIWPWQLRQCAYYVTVLVLLLLALLFLTALLRLTLYVCVFLLSLGRRQFWLFPNFFADCGFCESFRPAYSFEKTAASASPTKSSKREGGKRTAAAGAKKAAAAAPSAVEESHPPPTSMEPQPDAAAVVGDSEKVAQHGKQD